MNLKRLTDWLEAVGGCYPALELAPLRAAAAEAERALPGGRWQAGVRGGGFSRLILRHRAPGKGGEIPAAFRLALGLPKGAPSSAAAGGRPWLEACWDAERGRWLSARAPGAPLRPFSAGRFGDAALEKALAEFAALTGVSQMALDPASGRWSLPLGRGVAFPDFLRCDLSAAFTELCGQYALLMRDVEVAEVGFDGEALWAFCSG